MRHLCLRSSSLPPYTFASNSGLFARMRSTLERSPCDGELARRMPWLARALSAPCKGPGHVATAAAFATVAAALAARELQMEPAHGAEEEPKLRHVEKDVLIPKMMREKARDLCSDKVQAFTKCCQDTGILMVVKCREENLALKECLTGYYTDPAFYEECKAEYLKQREEYKATGIPQSQKHQRLPTSM